jgi:hypothetical protein
VEVIRNALGNWKICEKVNGILKEEQKLERNWRLVRRSGQLKRRCEALHIAGSTCRVQKGESLRNKWSEWTGRRLWPNRRREKEMMTLREIGIL